MYAVYTKTTVLYLGNDLKEALKVVGNNNNATMRLVNSLDDLAKELEPGNGEDVLSQAARAVLCKLEELGFTPEKAEELTEKVKDHSKKAVAEVRSLGIQGMKAVGEGFVALGDLLRKADDKDDEKDQELDSEFLDALEKYAK